MRHPLAALAAALVTACLLGAAPSIPAQEAGANDAAEMDQMLEQEQENDDVYRAYFPDEATGRKAAVSYHDQLLQYETFDTMAFYAKAFAKAGGGRR